MKRPEFDRDEEFLIAYYRQFHKSNQSRATTQDIVIVAVGIAFFALGCIKDDLMWSVIGFGLVVYRTLYFVVAGARYSRSIASLIEKYEEALRISIDHQQDAEQGGDGDAEEAV